jgi:hypothetical protein
MLNFGDEQNNMKHQQSQIITDIVFFVNLQK